MQKGGGRLPEKEVSRAGSAEKLAQQQKREIPELDVKGPFCLQLPGPNYMLYPVWLPW